MSDLSERVRQEAEKHKQRLRDEASAEGRARMDAEKRKAELDGGKEDYWSKLRASFLEAGREVKAAFPNDQISVVEGIRDPKIHKAKFPGLDVSMERVNDIRIVMRAVLNEGGGTFRDLEGSEYLIAVGEHGFYLQDAKNPNNSTDGDAKIESLMKYVINYCHA